jgi:hypothetical protein
VEFAFHQIATSIPLAVAIWAVMLLAVGAPAIVLLRLGRAPEPATPLSESDDARFAAEVAVAADRAAVTERRRRAEWRDAQEAVDAAWVAYEAADDAARRTAAACVFPTPARRRRPGENVERERYLHRAATAACRRHEISIKQLNEALAHRGWNPRLHPVVQEAALRNAVREHRFTAWQQATAAERQAWATAEAAADALRSLRDEALDAAVRVGTDLRPEGEPWWIDQGSATQPLPAIPRQSTVDRRHPIAA